MKSCMQRITRIYNIYDWKDFFSYFSFIEKEKCELKSKSCLTICAYVCLVLLSGCIAGPPCLYIRLFVFLLLKRKFFFFAFLCTIWKASKFMNWIESTEEKKGIFNANYYSEKWFKLFIKIYCEIVCNGIVHQRWLDGVLFSAFIEIHI